MRSSRLNIFYLGIFTLVMVGCQQQSANTLMKAARFRPEKIEYRLAQGDDINQLQHAGSFYSHGGNHGQVDIYLTALSMAVREGKIESVKILLAHGADPDLGAARLGYTPLAWAAYDNNLEIAKLLLDAGADPNLRFFTPYSDGEIPIYCATKRDNLELMRLLIAHDADLDAIVEGETSLHRALRSQHHDAIKLLVQSGASTTIPDARGFTPAEIAQRSGNPIVQSSNN